MPMRRLYSNMKNMLTTCQGENKDMREIQKDPAVFTKCQKRERERIVCVILRIYIDTLNHDIKIRVKKKRLLRGRRDSRTGNVRSGFIQLQGTLL